MAESGIKHNKSNQIIICLFTAIPLDQYTCDFEDGETCIFVDSTQDDFDWTRKTVSLLLKILNTVKSVLCDLPRKQ
jgi:hypothetical protein